MNIISAVISNLVRATSGKAAAMLDAGNTAPGACSYDATASSMAGMLAIFDGPALPALLAVAAVILVAYALCANGRVKRLGEVASSLGFRFVPDKDKTRMGYRFDHIYQLGSNLGTTRNHLIGQVGEWGVVACDHSYYNRYGRNHRFRSRGMVLVQIPHCVTETIIEPKSFGDKLLGLLGVKYVDFESGTFSRRFSVRAKDPNFAYDILHPDAMKWLLRHRKFSWELDRHTVAMCFEKPFKPRQIKNAIDTATEFIRMIPQHVWDKLRQDDDVEEESHEEHTNQRAVAVARVERQSDLTFARVKRARFFAPLALLYGLNQLWAAVTDFAHAPEMSNLIPNLFRAAFGVVFLLLFRKFYRRLRAYSEQRRAAGDCARAMYDEEGRVDTSELARRTGCADEAAARIHIQWAQRKGLVPSNAEVFSSGATAVEGTCPKCYDVWEFSSLDRGKDTDCPNCTARFKVSDDETSKTSTEPSLVA